MIIPNLDPKEEIDEAPGSRAWHYARASQLNVPGRGTMDKKELKRAVEAAEELPYGRHLTSVELKKEASKFKIKGRSGMGSDELAEIIYEKASEILSKASGPEEGQTLGDIAARDPEALRSRDRRHPSAPKIEINTEILDEEYWPVTDPHTTPTITSRQVIGYAPRSRYPGIMSSLFMNHKKALAYLDGNLKKFKDWELESFNFTFKGFQTKEPSNKTVRKLSDMPR